MHILLILILVSIVAFMFWRQFGQGQSAPARQTGSANAELPKGHSLEPVYISDGKLFHRGNQGEIRHIESTFVQDMKARLERDQKLAGWKEGTTWDTSFAQMRGMGERQEEGEVRFASVVRLNQNQLLYFLKSATFGGLFLYDFKTQSEQRLLHRQHLDYQDLSPANDKGQVLLASYQAGFNSHIALMDSDGNNLREVTGGDTLDCAPAWVKNKNNEIVYQSQGIARTAEGYIKGIAPSSIHLLNIADGKLETIFTSENYDYLKPQVSNNGDLYFIRRPYESSHYSNSNALMDVLFFPFRLLRAVFHYLNFFSMMYSRKPLTSAGGPEVKEDVKSIVIKGRRIEAEKALRKSQLVQGVPSLVPSSWQLIKCDTAGNQSVLANNVSSFYLNENDEIIYTNGCGIFYLNKQGASAKILQDKLIEELVL